MVSGFTALIIITMPLYSKYSNPLLPFIYYKSSLPLITADLTVPWKWKDRACSFHKRLTIFHHETTSTFRRLNCPGINTAGSSMHVDTSRRLITFLIKWTGLRVPSLGTSATLSSWWRHYICMHVLIWISNQLGSTNLHFIGRCDLRSMWKAPSICLLT